MRRWILYIILTFSTLQMVQAHVLRHDTSNVELRNFDADRLEKYKKDAKYNYKTKESWLKAMWNRFLEWLGKLFNRNVKDAAENSGAGNVMNAIIALIAIVLLVFGLSKVKFRTWVSGKGATVEQEYTVEEENIHDIDFDKDIRDAEADGDYRRAIRLQFLKVLKKLSDAELIFWDPNKTNYQYAFELKGTNIYEPFRKASYVFDLVWYGELKIDVAYYNNNKTLFEEIAKGTGKVKIAVFNG